MRQKLDYYRLYGVTLGSVWQRLAFQTTFEIDFSAAYIKKKKNDASEALLKNRIIQIQC